MITRLEVNETNNMIEHENLDVRTITLGISLLDCCDSDLDKLNEKIYNKITTLAKDLVPTGKQIERDISDRLLCQQRRQRRRNIYLCPILHRFSSPQ